MIEAKDFDCINNVFYLTPKENGFSDVYIAVRDKEQRFLNDKEVVKLPFCSKNNPHYKEWKLRQKSAFRFTNYIQDKPNNLKVLEIGCGNGWFSNLIAKSSNVNKVIGLDINSDELEQATHVFQKQNLQFAYGDIFKMEAVFQNSFDIIVLNASVQYFPSFDQLITQLKKFLVSNGEIHIIDSPFYHKEQVKKAKERSLEYYTMLGFPEMADNYFHHEVSDLENFKVLYKPNDSFYNKVVRRKDSPFMWLYCHKKVNP